MDNVSRYAKLNSLLEAEERFMLELEKVPSKTCDLNSLLEREEDFMRELESVKAV